MAAMLGTVHNETHHSSMLTTKKPTKIFDASLIASLGQIFTISNFIPFALHSDDHILFGLNF